MPLLDSEARATADNGHGKPAPDTTNRRPRRLLPGRARPVVRRAESIVTAACGDVLALGGKRRPQDRFRFLRRSAPRTLDHDPSGESSRAFEGAGLTVDIYRNSTRDARSTSPSCPDISHGPGSILVSMCAATTRRASTSPSHGHALSSRGAPRSCSVLDLAYQGYADASKPRVSCSDFASHPPCSCRSRSQFVRASVARWRPLHRRRLQGEARACCRRSARRAPTINPPTCGGQIVRHSLDPMPIAWLGTGSSGRSRPIRALRMSLSPRATRVPSATSVVLAQTWLVLYSGAL